jgi:5-formyltetrahydrofolate cyclo-ligase
MTKADLRRLYLEKRRSMPADQLERESGRIAEVLLANLDFTNVRYLHTFLPIQKFSEIDTWQFCRKLWSKFPQVQTVVPRLHHATGEMESCILTAESRLEINKWGIPEPSGGETIPPGQIDVILVPGLCFDRRGHRVGYGKGFYDRFLAGTRRDARKIGLSLFEPIDEIDDIHEGDIPVDGIATPAAVKFF